MSTFFNVLQEVRELLLKVRELKEETAPGLARLHEEAASLRRMSSNLNLAVAQLQCDMIQLLELHSKQGTAVQRSNSVQKRARPDLSGREDEGVGGSSSSQEPQSKRHRQNKVDINVLMPDAMPVSHQDVTTRDRDRQNVRKEGPSSSDITQTSCPKARFRRASYQTPVPSAPTSVFDEPVSSQSLRDPLIALIKPSIAQLTTTVSDAPKSSKPASARLEPSTVETSAVKRLTTASSSLRDQMLVPKRTLNPTNLSSFRGSSTTRDNPSKRIVVAETVQNTKTEISPHNGYGTLPRRRTTDNDQATSGIPNFMHTGSQATTKSNDEEDECGELNKVEDGLFVSDDEETAQHAVVERYISNVSKIETRSESDEASMEGVHIAKKASGSRSHDSSPEETDGFSIMIPMLCDDETHRDSEKSDQSSQPSQETCDSVNENQAKPFLNPNRKPWYPSSDSSSGSEDEKVTQARVPKIVDKTFKPQVPKQTRLPDPVRDRHTGHLPQYYVEVRRLQGITGRAKIPDPLEAFRIKDLHHFLNSVKYAPDLWYFSHSDKKKSTLWHIFEKSYHPC